MKEVERVRINYLVYCFFIIILLMCFLFPTFVSADMCSDEELVRLKVLANNISVHYEYLDADDESLDWGNTIPDDSNYAITISGLSEGLYIISDDQWEYEFNYSTSNNGEINYYIQNIDGDLSLKVYASSCDYDHVLRMIHLDLPIFNSYYNTKECQEIREKNIDLDVCQKIISKDLIKDESYFYNSIGKYLYQDKEEISFLQKILNWFQNPYFVIGAIVILLLIVCLVGVAIFRFIRRRRLE